MYFRGLMGKEISRYESFRKKHRFVEISYIPDYVGQTTKVRCLVCGEEEDISDYSMD